MNISIFFVAVCALVFSVEGQVASKLDLSDESQEESTSKSPSKSNGGTSNNKVSPKIEGVRVTVDAGDTKTTKETESKESVEIIDKKSSKRVGIHTDITFEITDDKNDSNSTSAEHGGKDNDASIPVFKGRTSTRRPQARLPYSPRIHFEYPDRPDYSLSERDRYHGHRIPVVPGTHDEGIYRTVDRWSNVIPINGVWTTERSSYYIPSTNYRQQDYNGYSHGNHYHRSPHQQPQYLSNQQQVVRSDSGWQPCVCISDNQWRDTNSIRSFRSVTDNKSNPAIRHASHTVSSNIKQ